MQLAARAVYSLHKRSTRQHIQRFCLETLAASSADVIAELRYDLRATYKHHRRAPSRSDVDACLATAVRSTLTSTHARTCSTLRHGFAPTPGASPLLTVLQCDRGARRSAHAAAPLEPSRVG